MWARLNARHFDFWSMSRLDTSITKYFLKQLTNSWFWDEFFKNYLWMNIRVSNVWNTWTLSFPRACSRPLARSSQAISNWSWETFRATTRKSALSARAAVMSSRSNFITFSSSICSNNDWKNQNNMNYVRQISCRIF